MLLEFAYTVAEGQHFSVTRVCISKRVSAIGYIQLPTFFLIQCLWFCDVHKNLAPVQHSNNLLMFYGTIATEIVL